MGEQQEYRVEKKVLRKETSLPEGHVVSEIKENKKKAKNNATILL